MKTIAKGYIVMPATNAVSERSFSALKRVKTYLRANTTDTRLNSIMTLHVDKEETDNLDLVKTANTFCSRFENRRQIFGLFTSAD